MLTLSEKLLLLGLHDEEGSVVFPATLALPYGLAGALLMELYLAEYIDFDGKYVKLCDNPHTDSELLNEALALIASSNKPRDAKYWLNAIHSKVKKIQQRLADQLSVKGALQKVEHRFMWVINYNRYPTADVKPEQEVRLRIKEVVLNDVVACDEDVALLSLVKACKLIDEVFDKSEREVAQERIDALTQDGTINKALLQTVAEITAAIMIVIMTSAIAVTTS